MHYKDLFSPHRSLIEPLEQRIAPALLVNGANLLGAGNPTTGQNSAGGTMITRVQVTSGDAIVWFENGRIDAISVGPNTSLVVYGDVGTIVGNLNANGTLSNSTGSPSGGLNGDVLLPNNILGITTHPLSPELGSIGAIVTGGSVSNLNVSGDVGSYYVLGAGEGSWPGGVTSNLGGIYAGTGAFRTQSFAGGGSVTVGLGGLDANPIEPGVQNSFVFAAGNARTVESGASIVNVKVGAADSMQLFAGNGFSATAASPGHPATPAYPGGSITNVTINSAFIDPGANSAIPSYDLMAGDGGSGTAGGAGGSIRNINEISSSGVVDILGGQGGSGTAAPGGAGGSIIGLSMNSLSSAYTVHAGKGGAGAPGGAGGSVTAMNFGGNALSNGIILAAPFTGGSSDDVLLIDTVTGTMILEQNDGHGGFSPVVQDPVSQLTTIAPIGSTPDSAVAADVGNGHMDIIVAYKNSDTVGVFLNQGGGVFYQLNYNSGHYAGDTEQTSSISLLYSPLKVAVGDFMSNGRLDMAVLSNNGGQTELESLVGNGSGGFSELSPVISLPSNPVSLIAANLPGQAYASLFAGYKTGEVDTILSNGSTTAAPFTVSSSITISGGLANLDYDAQDNLLLGLNGTATALNVYEPNDQGVLLSAASIVLTQQSGTALVAHFAPASSGYEPIEVLSSVGAGARLDVYTVESDTYVKTASVTSTEALTNFVPVAEDGSSGVAALGGSFGHFAFSQNGGAFYDVGLPFSGKKVTVIAGDGGDGSNTNTGIAGGGAGGSITGMSILAGNIDVEAGNGGTSEKAPAGAGGNVTNGPSIALFNGEVIPTVLEAENAFTLSGGNGGTASGASPAAIGGAGGFVAGLSVSVQAGDITIAGGDGGQGGGGAGGRGGAVTAVKAIDYGGDLAVTGGTGGAAGATGSGGAGGAIINLSYTLSLPQATQIIESPYNVTLTAGAGGNATAAAGGAGGAVADVVMSLQPSNESYSNPDATLPTVHTNTDTTLRVAVTAGNGGNGAVGGAGGAITTITSTSVFDQVIIIQEQVGTVSIREINPVAAQFTAGSGGNGSIGGGGPGGAVLGLKLYGISNYDPDSADSNAGQSPLVITSGNGGNGGTVGGPGGAIASITATNALFGEGTSFVVPAWTELTGATVISGHGGNGGTSSGGAGGTISALSIAVQGLEVGEELYTAGTLTELGGQITVQTGAGGSGGVVGRGGVGGSIVGSQLGSVDEAENYGLMLQSGAGGSGGLGGGAGGNVLSIQVNTPQNPLVGEGNTSPYDALSTLILAGNGGAATGATAVGGTGGSISAISETKDINSAINLLQAGNGGAAVATGGLGGSVTSVRTVGLIGQASDDSGNSFGAFQTAVDPTFFSSLFPAGVPEGVFAGRGGTGNTAGLAGSVISITAAQIAAIGAAANSQGLFAAAERVANVTAQVIGYDVNGNGYYDNASGTNRNSPAVDKAIDGFLFSVTAPTGVHVDDPALLEAFTFVG